MRKILLAASVVFVTGLVGCSSEAEPSMPDVLGKKLDVAMSDIERAGFKDDVEVVGGGMFGVVDESNWEVCEQLPGAGSTVTDAPRLTVDRSCGEGEAQVHEGSAESSTSGSDSSSAQPPAGSSEEATESTSQEASAEPTQVTEDEAEVEEAVPGRSIAEEIYAALLSANGVDDLRDLNAENPGFWMVDFEDVTRDTVRVYVQAELTDDERDQFGRYVVTMTCTSIEGDLGTVVIRDTTGIDSNFFVHSHPELVSYCGS